MAKQEAVAGRDMAALVEALEGLRALPESLRASRLRSIRDRYEMFLTLYEVTPAIIAAFRAGAHEFFDEEHVDRVRGMTDEEIASYAFVDRAYHYQFFSHCWEKIIGDSTQMDVRLDLWIQELGTSEIFQLVHLREGRYYPEFARRVNRVLYRAGRYLEDDVRLAQEKQAQFKISRETLAALETGWEEQIKGARRMMESAFFQMVDGLYYRLWSRDLPDAKKEELAAIFARHGLPLIPLQRKVFREILRSEKAFLAAEIESEEPVDASPPK